MPFRRRRTARRARRPDCRTKTGSRHDLLQAYGRNERIPSVIARGPRRTASSGHRGRPDRITYRTPSSCSPDGYLANGQEPWQIPRPRHGAGRSTGGSAEQAHSEMASSCRSIATHTLARHGRVRGRWTRPPISGIGRPTAPQHLLRPGQPRHRMVRLRQAKIDGIDVLTFEVDDPTGDAELLVIGGLPLGRSQPASGRTAKARRSRRRTCVSWA